MGSIGTHAAIDPQTGMDLPTMKAINLEKVCIVYLAVRCTRE